MSLITRSFTRFIASLVALFLALGLFVALAVSVEAQPESTVTKRSLLGKERIGKRAEGFAAIQAEVPAGQAQVFFTVRSKKVKNVDQISMTYFCETDDPADPLVKAKFLSPEGGVELPAKVGFNLPKSVDSSACYVSGGLSASFGPREGPITVKLVSVAKR